MEEKKKELSSQIELTLGFGELGEKLNAQEEDKFWRASGEDNRQESVERIHPVILEEGRPEVFTGGFNGRFRLALGIGDFGKSQSIFGPE